MHILWVLLLSAAAAMGVMAWRTARGARIREAARAELLKALAFPDASAVPASGPSISNVTISNLTPRFLPEQETPPVVDTYESAPPIFGEHEKPLTTLPRWWISLFAVGAAIAVVIMLYAMLAGDREAAHVTPPAARATAAPVARAPVDARPTEVPDNQIELIALQYKFGSGTAFDVHGVVRNPADGRTLPQVTAVVDLLDVDGRIITSKTTRLEQPGLEAGQTSTFSLVFPRVTGEVANYQVGFRLPGGDTILQIDRRASEPAAKPPAS